MIVVGTRSQLADGLHAVRRQGERLALVPTMGSLHMGHLSLIRRAREAAGPVALTIFVNPTQFGPGEDFDAYPRPLDEDLAKADAAGVDLVFAPEDETIVYPDGDPRVTVDPGAMGDRLCGAHRPGHFRGVLTVVAKLFGMIRPDMAIFGRKDFQQGVLIRRMVKDLELNVDIDLAPIVREEDGLALSSRNLLLSPSEREQAIGFHRGLSDARDRFRAGARDPAVLTDAVRSTVGAYPALELQYVELVEPEDLRLVEQASDDTVLALAGFCGATRLIDNVVLSSNGRRRDGEDWGG